MPHVRPYSRNEERANSITHGFGALMSLVGTVALTLRALETGDIRRIVTYPVFGVTMVLLYTASTLYHSRKSELSKARLKVLDHISIFYLIAGTYTPVTLVGMGGAWGWSIFAVVWTLALAGTVFKLFFTGRFPRVSTAIYVGMGWIVVVAVVPLIRSLSTDTLLWLLAGGLCYTGGVVFYAWRRLPFGHAVWHLFVIAGTASHFVAVMSL
ncbi:MAG: PAQR family membrane homeostasis protein TrhA [Spirochaetaceae bacterium]